jgi:hypothetical protein
MIPVYYRENRVMQLKGSDGATQRIEINKEVEQPNGMKVIENNIKDLSFNYEYSITASPSQMMQNKNTQTELTALYQLFPQAIPATIDIYAKSLDIKTNDLISRRLGASIPQNLLDYSNGKITIDQYRELQKQQQAQQMQQQQQQMMSNPEIQYTQAKTQKEMADAQTARYNAETARIKEQNAANNNMNKNANEAVKTHITNKNTMQQQAIDSKGQEIDAMKSVLSHQNAVLENK